ncbi:hypothetical protein OH77DRAFT_1374838, partial [Trametes cingulata]
IDFLVANNPHYEVSPRFGGLSTRNLDNLFGPGTSSIERGVPCAMEIGHIAMNDAVSGATDGYVPSTGPDSTGHRPTNEDMLMETVGYTDSSETPVSSHAMSMKALSHCLNGRGFIRSQAGSEFIPDFENDQLLSWLFPHLDPWGIGGFYHPRRSRRLNLEQQLKDLLMLEGSPFRTDPDFAFVYYNIRQKRAVLESVSFRVGESVRDRVIQDLLSLDLTVLNKLISASAGNPKYRPADAKDAEVMQVLARVNAVSHDLPGSNGYKVILRNEIRGLTNFYGTPTLFVTLNPSDRDHPLVRLFAGHEVESLDCLRGEELSRFERTVLAAKNPGACARFFHEMMRGFIDIVLRFGKKQRGLFG